MGIEPGHSPEETARAEIGEETGEGIASVEQFTLPEFEKLLLGGEILDSFTVAAFTRARLRGLV